MEHHGVMTQVETTESPWSHHEKVETTESPWEGGNHSHHVKVETTESPQEGGNHRVTTGE